MIRVFIVYLLIFAMGAFTGIMFISLMTISSMSDEELEDIYEFTFSDEEKNEE